MKRQKNLVTTAVKVYWWPYGAYNGPRYELNAAIRLYRLKQLPEPKKFEEFMEALSAAWSQSCE
jgi:hypothetical protein